MEDHLTSNYLKVCPECGGAIFHAVPDMTTEQEICDFQAEMMRRKGIMYGEEGWIHPGSYCYDCNWGTRATYIPEWAQIQNEDNRPATLILDSAGSEITLVAAAIKDGTGMTSKDALKLSRSAPVPVLQRPAARIWELKKIQVKIVEGGGAAHITQDREQAAPSNR